MQHFGRAIALLLVASTSLEAMESLIVRQEEGERHVEGRLLVEARDGGMLLLARDGTIWALQPEEIVKRSSDDRPYAPLKADELSKKLLEELPAGFRIHQTVHYTICYNTTPAYAQWCGSLYERLYRGFFNYWKTRGWVLTEPDYPLVALVFDTRDSFANYSRNDLGDSVDSIIGYYNLRTNRVIMYDLTGIDGVAPQGGRISDAARINHILSQPAAERTVATIIHEATHQLAYNCGMQTRMADNPLWVSEGLAVFFEAPDYKSDKGWRTIGAVNRVHLLNFHRFAPRRAPDSLLKLIASDKRFREPQQIADAYSEAWALNYFLLNRRRDQYVQYLKKLAEKKPLEESTPDERVDLFKEHFGDLSELDAEFLRFMARVR